MNNLPMTNDLRHWIKLCEERQTETAEFKRWFAGSKIVDEKGEPLVVYHGTNADFGAHEVQTSSRDFGSMPRDAFYFSSDPARSSAYAGDKEGANVRASFLSIKNPYLAALGETLPSRAALERAGYDGIMMDLGPDHFAAIERRPPNPNELEIAAFYPEQIKSAI